MVPVTVPQGAPTRKSPPHTHTTCAPNYPSSRIVNVVLSPPSQHGNSFLLGEDSNEMKIAKIIFRAYGRQKKGKTHGTFR